MDKAGGFATALVALVVIWMGEPPQALYVVVIGAILLFVLDYTTAHKAARLAGEQITTKKIREMTSAKVLSYWITGMGFICVGLMLRSWLPVTGIFGWIAYCEAMSNLENARKIAIVSGKTGTIFLGGVSRIADRYLGEIPGAKAVLGDVTISQTTTTDKTTTTQTDTQVHVSATPPKESEKAV